MHSKTRSATSVIRCHKVRKPSYLQYNLGRKWNFMGADAFHTTCHVDQANRRCFSLHLLGVLFSDRTGLYVFNQIE